MHRDARPDEDGAGRPAGLCHHDRLCRRVAILDRGRIVALDTPANLKAAQGGKVTLEDVFIALTGHPLEASMEEGGSA